MVKVWNTEDQGETSCPQCGTRYRVRMSRFPVRDSDYFDCNECGYRINSWNSTHVPSYEQISGPTEERAAD